MRIIILGLFFLTYVWGMRVEYRQWGEGQTFSNYLDRRHIPRSIMKHISKEDQKFLYEIRSGYNYYEMLDDNGRLEQALIPISIKMQIHLFRKPASEEYGFDIIPIVYREREYLGKVTIDSDFYKDTQKTTRYPKIAKHLSKALKDIIDTDKLHKGDEIDFVYTQRTRLGQLYMSPELKIIKVHMGLDDKYIYVDEDGAGYDESNKTVAYTVTGKKKFIYMRRVKSKEGTLFGMPLRHIRITSSFAYRRWHPILHRYRPHHGTDFGARRGTPLLAVNDGKVIYAGWMGGYGKVVKIKHAEGYISLYAHQSRMRVKRGQHVEKGQIIGYVGSTGRSTGPHLHFGLMKKSHWIDPMKVLGKESIGGGHTVLKKITKYKNVRKIKYKKVEIKHADERKSQIEAFLKNDVPSFIWKKEYFKTRLQDEEILEDEE